MSYAATFALAPQTQTLTLTTVTNNDTFTINGTTLTAVTSGGNGTTSFNIGSNDVAAAGNMAACILANPTLSTFISSAVAGTGGTSPGTVTLTSSEVLTTSQGTGSSLTSFVGSAGTVNNNEAVSGTLTVTGAAAGDIISEAQFSNTVPFKGIANNLQEAVVGQVLASGTNTFTVTMIFSSSGPTNTYTMTLQILAGPGGTGNVVTPTVPTGQTNSVNVAPQIFDIQV